MNLTFNGIDLGEVTSVGALAMTPVRDPETGELVCMRVRLEATLVPDDAEAEG